VTLIHTHIMDGTSVAIDASKIVSVRDAGNGDCFVLVNGAVEYHIASCYEFILGAWETALKEEK